MQSKNKVGVLLNNISFKLFPLGILLSTCTKLRIGGLPVGIGEIVLIVSTLLSIILYLKGKQNFVSINIKIFIAFWLLSFAILVVGIFFGYNIVPKYAFEDTFHDLFSYIFTSLVIIINWTVNVTNFDNTERILRLYLFYIYIYFLLISIAFFNSEKSLFGINFSYENFRMSGLSENPNQLACFIEIIPFLIIYQWTFEKNIMIKFYLVSFFILSIFVGISTISDGLVLAWSVAGGSCMGLWYLNISPKKTQSNLIKSLTYLLKYVIIPSLVILVISVLLLNAFQFANDVYDDGDQGSERIGRWKNGLKAIKSSPLFGFGPGSFSGQTNPFEKEEAHNSLIDWTLSTGILGLLLFICMMMFYFVQLFRNRILFCASLGLTIYIMFGYFLRHPFFWFHIILLVELAIYHKKRFLKLSEFKLLQTV